jgi:lysophospholipase L1-like esterase
MTCRPCLFFISAFAVSLVAAATLVSCGSPAAPSRPPTEAPSLACPGALTQTSPDGNPVPVMYSDPVISGGQSPFTLACTPVSGSTFAVGSTTVTCKVTDAVQRPATCTIPVTVVVPPKPVLIVTRFVAFGDSMTVGEDGLNTLAAQSLSRSHPAVVFPSFQTYPGVLKSELAGRYTTQSPTIFNAGMSGEKVTGSTTTEPKEAGSVRFSRVIAGGAYDVALIMEGANDLSNRDATIEPSVIAGLQSMLLDAKSRNMRVLLATIPPEQSGCCGAPDRGLARTLVPGFNDLVRNLAAIQGVALVDVYAALSGDVNTYIGPDGLHPTAAGYSKIAETFFDVIKQGLERSQTVTSSGIRGSRVAPGAATSSKPASAPRTVTRKPR